MKPFKLKIWLIISLLIFAALACDNANKNVQTLIATERAFSKLSEEKGIRTAFVTYFADDAIVFRPYPDLGKPLYQSRPEQPGVKLTWQPEYAMASMSGDLGFTTGPFELSFIRDSTTQYGYGHFVSIWKKQANGEWCVAVDLGIDHEKPQFVSRQPLIARSRGTFKSEIDLKAEQDAVYAVDQALYQSTNPIDLSSAYLSHASKEIWLLRSNEFPFIGIEKVKGALSRLQGIIKTKTDTAIVSCSADLAYSYGSMKCIKTDSSSNQFSYLHIWNKNTEGIWQLILDIALPLE